MKTRVIIKDKHKVVVKYVRVTQNVNFFIQKLAKNIKNDLITYRYPKRAP